MFSSVGTPSFGVCTFLYFWVFLGFGYLLTFVGLGILCGFVEFWCFLHAFGDMWCFGVFCGFWGFLLFAANLCSFVLGLLGLCFLFIVVCWLFSCV